MTNEETQNSVSESVDTTEDPNVNYIDAIKTLKENSVSRDKFNQVVADNKRLVEALTNGEVLSTETPVVKKTAEQCRNELFHPDHELNNLEYVTAALALRDAVLEESGQDIFVGNGHKYNPDASDYESAQRVANVMQECVDYAQGDSEVFTNELMRRTNDVRLPRR